MDENKVKRTLANAKSPIMDAVIHQRFAFSTKADAVKKIHAISEKFVKSTLAESVASDCAVLWVRDYQVTEDEIKAGYIGNYALLYPDQTPDGKHTVSVRKIAIDVQKHPQRKRQKSKHPDWGYWVLRRVKKNWRYGSIDEAYADLMSLCEDFPEVSIPGQNKLYTIVYRKTDDESLPLFRIVLEVEALSEGGFTITCSENTFKRDAKPQKESASVDGVQSAEPLGKFASMVAVKRNKRRNISETRKNENAQKAEGEA